MSPNPLFRRLEPDYRLVNCRSHAVGALAMLGPAGVRHIVYGRDDIVIPAASKNALLAAKMRAQRPVRDMRLTPCRVRFE